jgi:hypothetical protein
VPASFTNEGPIGKNGTLISETETLAAARALIDPRNLATASIEVIAKRTERFDVA